MKASRILVLVFTGLIITGIGSCNNQNKKTKDSEVKEFKSDLEDTSESAKELMIAEKDEAVEAAQAVIDDFESQLKVYEAKLESGSKQVKSEMKVAIENLKAEKQELEKKVDEINDATKEEWADMKTEFNHDMRDFKDSFKQFFEDNV